MSNALLSHISNTPSLKDSLIIDSAYQLLSTVGRGRNSVVYKALNFAPETTKEEKNDFLAIKVLLENNKQPYRTISRLKSEAEAMVVCDNEHVITLKDFIASENSRYLVMEYAENGDLQKLITQNSCGLTKPEALKLVLQVLEGLHCIHQQGIIHCDLKPENIFICKNNTLKIGDFSLAILPNTQPNIEEIKKGLGTFEYLAPECLKGEMPSPASDIYAVGVILFQLLTGHFPFPGTSFAEIAKNKIKGQSIPLSNLIPNTNKHLKNIVKKALANKPEKRFKTAEEFSDEIMLFLNEEAPTTLPLLPNWKDLLARLSPLVGSLKERIIAAYKINEPLRWSTFLVVLSLAILSSNSANKNDLSLLSQKPEQTEKTSAPRTITYNSSTNELRELLEKAVSLKETELKLRYLNSGFNANKETKILEKLDNPSLKLLVEIRESKLNILAKMTSTDAEK